MTCFRYVDSNFFRFEKRQNGKKNTWQLIVITLYTSRAKKRGGGPVYTLHAVNNCYRPIPFEKWLTILVSHFYPLRDERKGLYLFNILELLRHNFAIKEKLQDQSSVTYHACACKIVFFGQMYCIVPVTSKICQICSRWRHIKTPQKYQNQIKEALTILPYREVDRGQRFDYSYETRPIKTNIIKCT